MLITGVSGGEVCERRGVEEFGWKLLFVTAIPSDSRVVFISLVLSSIAMRQLV